MQDRNLQLIDLDPAGQQFAEKEFAGLNFGVGVSLTHDLGSHDRVKAASLANGIVRVDTEHNDVARIMLESHYFFTPEKKLMGKQWGWGPFVSLQPGSDQIIEAVGLGVMLGLKRNTDTNDTSSWNIGIGAVTDPNVKVLGDGIAKNQPLPTGESEIRYNRDEAMGCSDTNFIQFLKLGYTEFCVNWVCK